MTFSINKTTHASLSSKIFNVPDLLKKVARKVLLFKIRAYNILSLVFNKYPNVVNSHDSLRLIIEKHLSVSRFGDGELMIITGSGWGFQSYDNELANRLAEVLCSNNNDIAICIPDVFKDRSRFTKTARRFWINHISNNLHQWNKLTLKNKVYLDTQITRFYMDLKDKEVFPKESLYSLKRIWNKDHLLIVEGFGSRLGYNNDLFDNVKSIQRILCPAENAFSKYNQILEVSEKHAEGRLVLIALGMTATVLSYDLARKGHRAIDVGHVDIEYEWYKMKATRKVPVKHRYMNEVSSRKYDKIEDETFTSQIIAEIT